jgi:type IV secretion system protein VirB10
MDDAITIAEPTRVIRARIADSEAPEADLTGLDTSELTDVHVSKIPPGDPRLTLGGKRARTLRAGPAVAGAMLFVGVIAVSLCVAFSPASTRTEETRRGIDTEEGPAEGTLPLPGIIRDPPGAVAKADQKRATDGEPGEKPVPPSAAGRSSRGRAFAQERHEALIKAESAGVFAAVDAIPSDPPVRPGPSTASGASGDVATGRQSSGTSAGSEQGRGNADPNLQDRKNDFLTRAGVSTADYADKSLVAPRSPYELKAGTVIPTVLITGMNSDLPGQVLGQVRENVYDTVSGNYLLIPQGSRLVAAYDSMVAWGQQRVLVCWNRLIRPDGSSIQLDCMPGVDLAGYSGFADEIDNHWWRIISGAAFASLLAATAQRSQGDVAGFQPSFPQLWATNAAGSINQAGQQLTQKNLQIQPTITVRPGFSVNVFVSRDLILPPYHPQGATP